VASGPYAAAIDAEQDPGSHVVPTNDMSRRLLASEPAARRAWFQSAITEAGRKCGFVRTAVLKAGDNGIDLWRVGCAEEAWLVTLDPSGSSVESCAVLNTAYCADGLKALEWRSQQS
jgi:hypothetical protein